MAIRPARLRRTCTLSELLNWVVLQDLYLPGEGESSLPNYAFERGRADIEAALRDLHIQPLGFHVDHRFDHIGLKDIIKKIDDHREDALPLPRSEKSERISSDFWAYAQVDWGNSRARDRDKEYVNIHCLMDEVLGVWPAEASAEGVGRDSISVSSIPFFGKVGDFTSIAPSTAGTVPASDRVVRRDDNRPLFDAAVEALDETIVAVGRANDIGDLTADERSVVLSQLREGRKLFELPEIKVSAVRALIEPKLRWLIDKAGGAVVGATALATLQAIANLFGLL